jgi:hypothetical protein
MVPESPVAITEAWLSDVLGTPTGTITVEPLDEGSGLLAALARVATAAGDSFIVKMPSTDPRTRAIAQQFGYYAREAGTYHSLLPRAGVVTPACHAIIDGPLGPVLVLEDLAPRRAGDQLAGADVRDAHAAAVALARVHAAFWNDPALAACTWLPGPTDTVVHGYGRLFELTWEPFRSLVDGDVPAEHLAAAERAMTHWDDVCAAFSAAPRTLVHGDYRLDNVLFDDEGNAAMIDWQLAAWGRGAYDLALFLAGSVDTVVRREHGDSMIRSYHDTLVAAGVEGYTLDDCRRDVQRGYVLNLPNPVTALVAVPAHTERAAALLRANARRALAAVADCEPYVSF